MLPPPSRFQGAYGQEEEEGYNAQEIDDVLGVDHASCEVVEMATEPHLADDLTGETTNGIEGPVGEEEGQQYAHGDHRRHYLVAGHRGCEQSNGQGRRTVEDQSQVSGVDGAGIGAGVYE